MARANKHDIDVRMLSPWKKDLIILILRNADQYNAVNPVDNFFPLH